MSNRVTKRNQTGTIKCYGYASLLGKLLVPSHSMENAPKSLLDKSFSEWLRKFVKGELLEVWQINELTTLVIIGTFSLD